MNLLFTVPNWPHMYSAAAVALGPSMVERSDTEQVRGPDMLTELRQRDTEKKGRLLCLYKKKEDGVDGGLSILASPIKLGRHINKPLITLLRVM